MFWFKKKTSPFPQKNGIYRLKLAKRRVSPLGSPDKAGKPAKVFRCKCKGVTDGVDSPAAREVWRRRGWMSSSKKSVSLRFFPAKTKYVFFLFTVSPSTLHHHHHLLKLRKAKRLRPAEKKQGEGGEVFWITNV